MSAGRKPTGAGLVAGLQGSAVAKARLRLVLETLTGERTITAACQQLGIGERRWHDLRQQMFQAALAGLEPRPAGRPRQQADAPESRVATLEAAVRELRLDL